MNRHLDLSDNGLKLIAKFEGCRLEAYQDVADVWTIGYGHTGKVDGSPIKEGLKITQSEAEALLREDSLRFVNYVNHIVARQLTQNQFDSLASFCYNLGYQLKGTLLLLVNGESPDNDGLVTDKMKLYCKALVNGELKPINGLIARRIKESELYLKND